MRYLCLWKSFKRSSSVGSRNFCRFERQYRLSNLQVVNAILFWSEWRKCAVFRKALATGTTYYTRIERWAKAGVLDRWFETVAASGKWSHQARKAVSLRSTIVKVHPDEPAEL